MKNACMIAAIAGFGASIASAQHVEGMITADNHYAIFAVGPESLQYVGGNEIGAGGAPGTYNWSIGESWAFETRGTFYIAAWSDDAVAQGVLADFTFGDSPLFSGDARWEVFTTNENRGDGDPHPTIAEMMNWMGIADSNEFWQAPFVGNANGDQPWGTIAGIDNEARWMWASAGEDPDPLHGGSGLGELLVFRITPAPGALAAFGMAGLAGLRRRR